jgi:HlyD family secretion protein
LVVREAEPEAKAGAQKGAKQGAGKDGPDRSSGGRRDQEGVYLMREGKADFRPIETGLLGELSIEVVKGLEGGETAITGPFRALRALKPGDPVKVEKPKPEAGRP